MQIRLITDALHAPHTGIAVYTAELLAALQRLGAAVTPVDRARTWPQVEYCRPLPRVLPLQSYGWHLLLPRRMPFRPDSVIRNPSQMPTFFRFDNPCVLSVHDIHILQHPRQHPFLRALLQRILLPRTLRQADAIIASSDFTRAQLTKTFPDLAADRIHTVPLAAAPCFHPIADRAQLETCRHTYRLPERFILCVGTLEPRKNLVRLLRAFARVRADIDLPLVLCGIPGWHLRPLRETLRVLDLHSSVQLTGYVAAPDLPCIYNLAEYFVYPSLYEGFGLPPLEAMQCGCPVITGTTPAVAEVTGSAAYQVDPYNETELADALRCFARQDDLRHHHADAALERAALFSWEQTARQTLQVYQEVLDAH